MVDSHGCAGAAAILTFAGPGRPSKRPVLSRRFFMDEREQNLNREEKTDGMPDVMMEIPADEFSAEQLKELINSFGLDAKVVERKEHFVVYLKEGEQIVDLLNIMEAPLALMDLENVRIMKEMRNDINRKVNCETANLNKVVGAAVKQLEDIEYIEEKIGLSSLPEQLEEIARLRLEYPDKSLKELGSFLSTPVGKSGVNHRLRKISNIAEALREGKGEVE
jgi:DNA-binding protein WhiA